MKKSYVPEPNVSHCTSTDGELVVPWPLLTARQTWKYVSSHVSSFSLLPQKKTRIDFGGPLFSYINYYRTHFIGEKSKA